jgi:pimeloyl-ACP methyl ester carboxylesterase
VSIINQFLSINGNKVEVLVKGDKGIRIFILTGMGCSFDEWYDITEILSKSNRVIMYHRPGLGESKIGIETRNTETTVKELNELILSLEITDPIILVGHSYGGLCAQHFAKIYSHSVAGLILIDSTSVDFKKLDELGLPVLDEGSTDEIWIEKCKSYSLMSKEDLRKDIQPSLSIKQKHLPTEIHQRLIDFQINPTLYKAMYCEIENWSKDADTINELGDLSNLPLIVIGRDKDYCIDLGVEEGLPDWELKVFEEKWQELIINQAKLSSNSELIFAKQASHSIYLDRSDIVLSAISKMVEKVT